MLRLITLLLTLLTTSCQPAEIESHTSTSDQPYWEDLYEPATRFPYFEGEHDPTTSRACHDGWDQYGADAKIFFVAVADISTSSALWPSGLGPCHCPDGGDRCIPSCSEEIQKAQCGRKIQIRCTDPACVDQYRNKPVVVMIRDVCPWRHERNLDAGHCQRGNGIDLFRSVYEMMTEKGNEGPNLAMQFSALQDQSTPLGLIDAPTASIPYTSLMGSCTSNNGQGYGDHWLCENGKTCSKQNSDYTSICIVNASQLSYCSSNGGRGYGDHWLCENGKTCSKQNWDYTEPCLVK